MHAREVVHSHGVQANIRKIGFALAGYHGKVGKGRVGSPRVKFAVVMIIHRTVSDQHLSQRDRSKFDQCATALSKKVQ
ncbi:hypothetical protein TorRG33x02_302930 [Trema orientale]|uniref:Uncharacterized protein n=1 Tax=Trema orientale TaxID=63057 RepID=A0A2P5BZW3_TREOI|nr:hypothetical protein TorRG33x02_302930 [Trema orientale]